MKPPRHSPARAALAALRRDLDSAAGQSAAARAPVTRLEAVAAESVAAAARRAETRRAHAERLAAWAVSGAGPAPETAPSGPPPDDAAAQAALADARRTLAQSEAAEARLAAAIPQAVAAVLREDGAARVAEYWRLYAGLEGLRRELAALDQVLLADFPVMHAVTGRPILAFLAPEKLSAPAARREAAAACAALQGADGFAAAWRQAVAALAAP